MEVAKDFTTKAGDLEEAIKLKKRIELLKKDIRDFAKDKEKNVVLQNQLSIAGTAWEIQDREDVKTRRLVTFHPDGMVTVKTDKNTYRGKYSRHGNQWRVDLGDRDTDLVTIVGTKVFWEHWRQEQRGHAHHVFSGWKVK